MQKELKTRSRTDATEQTSGHRLPADQLAGTVDVVAGLLAALEAEQSVEISFGGSKPMPVPPAAQDAILDTLSMLAAADDVTLFVLESERLVSARSVSKTVPVSVTYVLKNMPETTRVSRAIGTVYRWRDVLKTLLRQEDKAA